MNYETIECVGGPMDGGIYAIEEGRNSLGFNVKDVLHIYVREESFIHDKKDYVLKYHKSVVIPKKKEDTNEG